MKAVFNRLSRNLVIALVLALCAMGCAVLAILKAGSLAALVGADEKIVSVLSQLSHAQLVLPWLVLIPGTIVLALTVGWFFRAKKWISKAFSLIITALLWLALLVSMLPGTSVNSVPVHTALRILINLIKGGVLHVL